MRIAISVLFCMEAIHQICQNSLARFADMKWQTFGIGLPFVGHFNPDSCPDFRTLMQYPVT